jgi:hypothetical protein
MTNPDLTQDAREADTDAVADPDRLESPDTPLTTDEDQQTDDLDPNTGEGGAG